jgi:hypothetical protein
VSQYVSWNLPPWNPNPVSCAVKDKITSEQWIVQGLVGSGRGLYFDMFFERLGSNKKP